MSGRDGEDCGAFVLAQLIQGHAFQFSHRLPIRVIAVRAFVDLICRENGKRRRSLSLPAVLPFLMCPYFVDHKTNALIV